MKQKIAILIAALLLPVLATAKEPAKPLTVDTIQVLKIAGQDERAVIKTPDGKMRIIKVGDPVGDHAKVIEITTGRVVIEEKKAKESETVIIRLENGKQHLERLKKAGENDPQAYAANTTQEAAMRQPAVQEKQPTEVKKDKKDKEEQEKIEQKRNKKAQEKKISGGKSGTMNIKSVPTGT